MKLTYDKLREHIEKLFPFVERMGIKVLAVESRYVKLAAPLTGNDNHIGSMYAGALFTLAELPGGALFFTSFDADKYYPVVKEMNIRFRRPAMTGVTIELSLSEDEVARITAEAEKNKKAEFILKGEIKDESGEVVARSKGLYQIRAIGT